MYFNKILYSLIVIYSIGLAENQVFASSLYFTAPPQGFGLSENNIGGYNAAQEKIYTCISAYTNNVLTPISGETEFAIAFGVVSLSEAVIGIADTGAFNPDNQIGSDGEKLSCSGKYETTTQMYEDTILVGASPMRVTFSLLDADLFTFKLATAETLLQKLSALTYDPAKNSKTMPVENNIAVTFNSDIIRGQGTIALKDTDGSTIESYESSDSENITITGSLLTINPSVVLASDKNYSVDFPAGAFKDATGRNSEAVLGYGFKTQIDLAFILRGYNGTTLYETADAFTSQAEWAMSSLTALSFNRVNTHRVNELDISPDGGDYYQSLADIEVVDAALDNWGPISTDLDALPGKFEEHKTNSEALQNPTPEEISVLTNLRQWLVDNRKGAATGWSTTTVGSQHYDAWVQPKVLRWGGTAAPFFFDGLRLPAGFNPKEYKILAFILSSQDAYNTSAMASSFNAKQGTQWNIQDSLGNKYTHKQNFFYSDHSGFSGQDPGILVNSNGGTDIHEAMHAFGQGGHDQDPLCIGYSTMSQCGGDADLANLRKPPTYPVYNRIYVMGWLPETAITTDPTLVHDIYNATDPTKKYLLKVGRFLYQELYQGSWYQYRVPSLQRQLDECRTMPQPIGACTPLLVDKSCGVESLLVVNYWDSQECEFIDIDEDISRDIFAAYMDGRVATGVNFDALEIEVADDTLRN